MPELQGNTDSVVVDHNHLNSRGFAKPDMNSGYWALVVLETIRNQVLKNSRQVDAICHNFGKRVALDARVTLLDVGPEIREGCADRAVG